MPVRSRFRSGPCAGNAQKEDLMWAPYNGGAIPNTSSDPTLRLPYRRWPGSTAQRRATWSKYNRSGAVERSPEDIRCWRDFVGGPEECRSVCRRARLRTIL